jgi:hypothetical protein
MTNNEYRLAKVLYETNRALWYHLAEEAKRLGMDPEDLCPCATNEVYTANAILREFGLEPIKLTSET